MSVVVASTCAPYKAENGLDQRWLTHAEAWRESGHTFFCALQAMDGLSHRLEPLERRLQALGAEVWWFSITAPNVDTIDGRNRLTGITTGRNLAHEYAANRCPNPPEAILFLDTDVTPPADGIERLMEVDRPLVGGHIPCYCLDGMRVVHGGDTGPHLLSCTGDARDTSGGGPVVFEPVSPCLCHEADIREHWTSAGALLLRGEAYRRLRWRWDLLRGVTDDPALAQDAIDLGFGTQWIRHDTIFHHDGIGPVETRGHDLRSSAG